MQSKKRFQTVAFYFAQPFIYLFTLLYDQRQINRPKARTFSESIFLTSEHSNGLDKNEKRSIKQRKLADDGFVGSALLISKLHRSDSLQK